MNKVSKRGFDESDKRWFSEKELIRLKKAHEEIKWLIDRDYKIESVVTFVGDRYQFSTRQRNALKRATCTSKNEIMRKQKELSTNEISKDIIHIDGFNLIITLEVALSGGTLILGNDASIRDLAGLRGTYKLIDKTDIALELIGRFLKDKEAKVVKFYLDTPVSNSGKLKSKILEHSQIWSIKTNVELVNNADVVLEKLDRVVSSDATIIDRCGSYFNITQNIINEYITHSNIVDFINI